MSGLLPSWKQLFMKYVQVSNLSLILDKKDCGEEMSEEILQLLMKGSYKMSAISAFVQFTSQLVTAHPPPADQNFYSTTDLVVLELIIQEAALLQSIDMEDPTKSGKAAKLLAKTLQSIMFTQSGIKNLLKILTAFYHILCIASMKQSKNDENVSSVSPVLCVPTSK